MAQSNKKNFNLTEETLNSYESEVADAIRFNDIDKAKHFTREVWPIVERDNQLSVKNPGLYNRLSEINNLYKILLVATLSEGQLVSLFKNGIGSYFTELLDNVDLWQLVRGNLLSYFHEYRDDIKEKIYRALLENEETITKEPLKRGDKMFQPTIKEWLIDYISVVGIGIVDRLKMNEYFTENDNFCHLPEKEKIRVRTLISFYERLKLSSLNPEGLEEKVQVRDGDVEFIFDEGRFEIIRSGKERPASVKIYLDKLVADKYDFSSAQLAPSPKKPSDNETLEQEILAAYQGDLRQQKAISKEENKLAKKFKDNINKLRQEFFGAVQRKKVFLTIAILRRLAQQDDLLKFMAENEKLNNFLAAIWEKQYGKEFAEEFRKNPVQLRFLRLFLQYVLQERLNLPVSDAARVGLQIGNIFASQGKKEYNKMAYFDVKSKSFKWFD